MKNAYALLLVVPFLLMAGACKKKIIEPNYEIKGDYFITGHVGGFTTPQSQATYYLVNSGQMRKDMTQLDQAPPENITNFNFHFRMNDDKYRNVADLPGTIPAELLSRNNETFGKPLPDAGVTDIWASINGTTYRWHLEADLDSVNWNIQQFAQRIREDFPQ